MAFWRAVHNRAREVNAPKDGISPSGPDSIRTDQRLLGKIEIRFFQSRRLNRAVANGR
jgi:hypothetical protein